MEDDSTFDEILLTLEPNKLVKFLFLKLAQVLYSGLGGHGAVALSLIKGDIQHQLEHQLVFYGIEPTKKEYLEFIEENNINHKSILKKQGVNFKYWRQYLKALKELNPDVILLHSSNLIVPSVYYCKQNKGCKLINVEHLSNQLKGKPEWLWTKISLKRKVTNVYLTNEYLDEINLKFGALVDPDRTFIIPNGIDTELYSKSQTNAKDNFIITMQGRFSNMKDQIGLIKAFEKANLPESVELHFAGYGENFDNAKSYASNSEKREKIVFHGMLNENDLVDLMNRSDLYVHASFGETMSTAIMQAMAMGLPVVGSNIPGINNLFEDGRSGMAFNNEKELISILEDLFQDQSKRESLGENAKVWAQENYDLKKMFDKYLSIINS